MNTNQVHSNIACEPEYNSLKIYYTKLPQKELALKADTYYKKILNEYKIIPAYSSKKVIISDNMAHALILYSILSKICPDNNLYKIRLGYLYDLIEQDKFTKSCYLQVIGNNPNLPEPYFKLGEFYYRRELYRKALELYKEAFKKGYTEHYLTLYKIGDICEKFGDTKAALKYLKLAEQKNPNIELKQQISRIEIADNYNQTYYIDTRIRLKEQ